MIITDRHKNSKLADIFLRRRSGVTYNIISKQFQLLLNLSQETMGIMGRAWGKYKNQVSVGGGDGGVEKIIRVLMLI